MAKVGKKSFEENSDEYGTPLWLFNVLHEEFGFLMDVCSSKKNYKCVWHYTLENDSLDRKNRWSPVNFCNPPYSFIDPWYERQIEERDNKGAITVGPVKYDPSTKHGKLAAAEMDEIRIIEHRIKFEGAKSSATFPVAIMVCRPRLYTRKTGANIFYVNYKELIK